MNTLLIVVSDETKTCSYALRLAIALQRVEPSGAVCVFLLSDAVNAACKEQSARRNDDPDTVRTLKQITLGNGRVLLDGSYMDEHGISDEDVGEGVRRSTIHELAAETLSAEKVLVF